MASLLVTTPLRFGGLNIPTKGQRIFKKLMNVSFPPLKSIGKLALVASALVVPLTSQAQPAASTLTATNISSTAATLLGQANPNGPVTQVYFQYGPTTNYG